MKKAYLLALALLLPVHAGATQHDSVYTWGKWSQGIQPAAGPVAKVTPPPVKTPNVNFRPNETAAFLREATVQARFATAPILAPAPVTLAAQVTVIPITTTTSISTTGPSTGGF